MEVYKLLVSITIFQFARAPEEVPWTMPMCLIVCTHGAYVPMVDLWVLFAYVPMISMVPVYLCAYDAYTWCLL